jgi:hypothetical protein
MRLFLSLSLHDHVCGAVCGGRGRPVVEVKSAHKMPLLHVDATARQMLDGKEKAPTWFVLLGRMRDVLLRMRPSTICSYNAPSQGKYGSER